MVYRRFADTAFSGKIAYCKIAIPIIRDVFDRSHQGLVKTYIALLQLDHHALQKLIKLGIIK